MSISLGGIDLNPNLQWVNQFQFQRMAQTAKRTLAGGQVVYQQPLVSGIPIELEATESTGWFTHDMVVALEALAAVTDTLHTFNFHGIIHETVFDYSTGAFEFIQIEYRQVRLPTDHFYGTVNLLTA